MALDAGGVGCSVPASLWPVAPRTDHWLVGGGGGEEEEGILEDEGGWVIGWAVLVEVGRE